VLSRPCRAEVEHVIVVQGSRAADRAKRC